jgi:hypothetical protein
MANGLQSLAAAMLALAASACAAFVSQTPVFPPADGAALFGAAPARLIVKNTDDNETLRLKSRYEQGVYRLENARKREDPVVVSFHALPGIEPSGAFFLAQVQDKVGDDSSYTYDLVRTVEDGFWAYGLSCLDLTEEERVTFGFLTEEAPERAQAPDTGMTSTSCEVRNAAQVEAAFALLASRIAPKTYGELRPKPRVKAR